jgi:hypothetical protein
MRKIWRYNSVVCPCYFRWVYFASPTKKNGLLSQTHTNTPMRKGVSFIVLSLILLCNASYLIPGTYSTSSQELNSCEVSSSCSSSCCYTSVSVAMQNTPNQPYSADLILDKKTSVRCGNDGNGWFVSLGSTTANGLTTLNGTIPNEKVTLIISQVTGNLILTVGSCTQGFENKNSQKSSDGAVFGVCFLLFMGLLLASVFMV